MRLTIIAFFLFLPLYLFSQVDLPKNKAEVVITPELMVAYPAKPNEDFVSYGLQTLAVFNLGWEHGNTLQEWAHRLKGPRTGINVGYTSLGNKDQLGGAYSIMPFVEFKAFRNEDIKVHFAMGGSYFTKPYDSISNPKNRAIVTDLNLTFRASMHYYFISGDQLDWRAGLGYIHHSNGHSYLPNEGVNTSFVGLSADIKTSKKSHEKNDEFLKKEYSSSIYSYMGLRFGYGSNVLSEAFNNTKGVYGFSAEYGKLINNTFKLGVGFYYRFYQNYYDYISNNEQLVQDGEEFDFYKESPWWYATNIGLFVSGEVLLNHVGLEGQLGLNIHKPGYKIAWRIAQGWPSLPSDFTDYSLLGKYNTIYNFKKLISSRMGIKYYLKGTNKAPMNDFYFAVHINANLGQADYTEFTLGYVHNFYSEE